jgi:hypothetical protein
MNEYYSDCRERILKTCGGLILIGLTHLNFLKTQIIIDTSAVSVYNTSFLQLRVSYIFCYDHPLSFSQNVPTRTT